MKSTYFTAQGNSEQEKSQSTGHAINKNQKTKGSTNPTMVAEQCHWNLGLMRINTIYLFLGFTDPLPTYILT